MIPIKKRIMKKTMIKSPNIELNNKICIQKGYFRISKDILGYLRISSKYKKQ